MSDPILTAKEIAAELRCTHQHVRDIMRGKVAGVPVLPHLALGRKLVVRRSSFEEWKKRAETGGIVPPGSKDDSVGAVN